MNGPSESWRAQKLAVLERVYRKVDTQHERSMYVYCAAMIAFVVGVIYFDLYADQPYTGGLLQNAMVLVTLSSIALLSILAGVLLALTPVRSWLQNSMKNW